MKTEYIISLTAYKPSAFDPQMRVMIDVEESLTGDLWRGDFQQKYLEEICQKAGKPMPLQKFIQTLQLAMQRKFQDMYYLDLLTQSDLLALKAKKQGLPYEKPHQSQEIGTKRYLILTNTENAEKVHFPMPLQFLAEPGIEVLRKTLERMQSESVKDFSQYSESHRGP